MGDIDGGRRMGVRELEEGEPERGRAWRSNTRPRYLYFIDCSLDTLPIQAAVRGELPSHHYRHDGTSKYSSHRYHKLLYANFSAS